MKVFGLAFLLALIAAQGSSNPIAKNVSYWWKDVLAGHGIDIDIGINIGIGTGTGSGSGSGTDTTKEQPYPTTSPENIGATRWMGLQFILSILSKEGIQLDHETLVLMGQYEFAYEHMDRDSNSRITKEEFKDFIRGVESAVFVKGPSGWPFEGTPIFAHLDKFDGEPDGNVTHDEMVVFFKNILDFDWDKEKKAENPIADLMEFVWHFFDADKDKMINATDIQTGIDLFESKTLAYFEKNDPDMTPLQPDNIGATRMQGLKFLENMLGLGKIRFDTATMFLFVGYEEAYSEADKDRNGKLTLKEFEDFVQQAKEKIVPHIFELLGGQGGKVTLDQKKALAKFAGFDLDELKKANDPIAHLMEFVWNYFDSNKDNEINLKEVNNGLDKFAKTAIEHFSTS